MEMDTRATGILELSSSAGTTNNAALTAASAKAPTVTKPVTAEASGRFVVDLTAVGRPEGFLARAVHYFLAFALSGADGVACTARVWIWLPWGETWVPFRLMDLAVTAGARTGVSGADVDDTWRFADTIVVSNDASRGASAEAHASAEDGVCRVSVDASGPVLLEVEVTKGTATAVRVGVGAL